jgi:PAS domain S-box-containing protein
MLIQRDRAERSAVAAEKTNTRLEELAGKLEADVARAREAAEEAERLVARAEQGADVARAASEHAEVEARVAKVQSEASRVHAQEAGRFAREARDVSEVSGRGDWRASATHRRRPFAETMRRRQLAKPKREPRSGFDDATDPMAVIELDGRFRELNPRFSELVGYSEADFQSASWPPVSDREKLSRHRDELEAMQAGSLDEVEVDTCYVHAQGLQVPVAGRLRLVRDDDGDPDHLLLEVKAPQAV